MQSRDSKLRWLSTAHTARPAYLAHGLWVSCACREVPVQVQATVQATPAVVARSGVGQAGRHQGNTLQQRRTGNIIKLSVFGSASEEVLYMVLGDLLAKLPLARRCCAQPAVCPVMRQTTSCSLPHQPVVPRTSPCWGPPSQCPAAHASQHQESPWGCTCTRTVNSKQRVNGASTMQSCCSGNVQIDLKHPSRKFLQCATQVNPFSVHAQTSSKSHMPAETYLQRCKLTGFISLQMWSRSSVALPRIFSW